MNSCYGRVSGDFICGSWGSMTTKRDDYNLVHDRLSEPRPKSVPEMKGTSNWTTIRVIHDLEQFIHMNMAAPNWNWTSQYLLLLWIWLYLCAQATEEVGERFLEFNFDWITLKTIKGMCKKGYKIINKRPLLYGPWLSHRYDGRQILNIESHNRAIAMADLTSCEDLFQSCRQHTCRWPCMR